MDKIETSEKTNSNNLGDNALLDHSQKFSKDLRETWSRLFTEHLDIVFHSQLEFIYLSEQQWNTSSTQFDRLGFLAIKIQDYFDHSTKNSISPFEKFQKGIDEAIIAQIDVLPETIVRKLDVQMILHNPEQSKSERSAKASKRFKKKIGISPKSKIPYRKLATLQMEFSSVERLRAILFKLGEMESNFQESWFDILMSLPEKMDEYGKSKFEALRKLVAKQRTYLHSYVLESADFISKGLERESLKVNITGVLNQQLQQSLELPKLKEILGEELLAYGLNSNKNKLLLNLRLEQLKIGVLNELNNLKAFADKQLYQPALQQLIRVENWLSTIENSPIEGYENLELGEQFAFDDLVLNDSLLAIQQMATAMPSQISISTSLNNVVDIDAAYLCDCIIEESIQVQLQGLVSELPSRYASSLSSLSAKVRFLESTKTNKIEGANKVEVLKNSILQCDKQLVGTKEELLEIKEKFELKLDQLGQKGLDRLSLEVLVSDAQILNKTSQRKQKLSSVSGLSEKILNPLRFYAEKYRRFLSNTRKDIVYSEFRSRNSANESTHAQLRTFVESISPDYKALENLPFYYQQLFIGKHAPKSNLFHFRNREMELARVAVDRLDSGTGGAIMVLGDPLSGRSFFCDMLCLELEPRNIYRIEAPLSGTTNPNKLYQAIGKQLNSSSIDSKVLEDAPDGSVFLFNDLELWWERHHLGWNSLDALKKMIECYSHKHLFILNTTPYAYRLMRLKLELDQEIIASIPLSPFHPKNMEKVLRQRHTTGDLVFSLDGKGEDLISERQRLALVEDLSDITEGNVGATFHLWLGLMTACDGDTISLISPKQRELPILQNKDHLIVLAQLILHKHLGPKKLSRILVCSVHESNEQLQNLKRSGLIIEVIGGSFRIIPYALPFIIRQLKKFQLI